MSNADVEPDDTGISNRMEIVGRVINRLTKDQRENVYRGVVRAILLTELL